MKRYYTSFGAYPKPVQAQFTMCGPQAEDQIPEGVKLLLSMPGVTQVDVRFDHGQGERINIFRVVPEEKKSIDNSSESE